MRLDVLKKLNVERAARRPAVLVTDLTTGEQRLVVESSFAQDPLQEKLEAAVRSGKSGSVEWRGATLFLTVQAPPPKLVAIGAAHVTQALAPMARLLGFDMTVVDPRSAFATKDRFPDVALEVDWPDAVLPKLRLDRFTALACFTHDPKIDDPALVEALRSDCFYIGALGSRKTHAKRLERLAAAGFSPEQTSRIKAPIGLDIGAVSPAEIAVSVIAEIVMALRKKPLRVEKEAAA
jgi:xanthine dehydrogenase accessory factor